MHMYSLKNKNIRKYKEIKSNKIQVTRGNYALIVDNVG